MPESAHIIASVDAANLMPYELAAQGPFETELLVRNERIITIPERERGKNHTAHYDYTSPDLPHSGYGAFPLEQAELIPPFTHHQVPRDRTENVL